MEPCPARPPLPSVQAIRDASRALHLEMAAGAGSSLTECIFADTGLLLSFVRPAIAYSLFGVEKIIQHGEHRAEQLVGNDQSSEHNPAQASQGPVLCTAGYVGSGTLYKL